MEIVLYILGGLVAVVGLFLLLAALRPAEFRIARSAAIAAPPSAIVPHINDLHKWAAWSPFEKLDPAMKKTFSGPAAGVGASYAWNGNAKAGEGHMTITESHPERVVMDLQFIRPFPAKNVAEFTLVPEGGTTRVTWAITGRNNLMAKAFGMLVNIDKMVGRDFEAGLASLKAIAEAPR